MASVIVLLLLLVSPVAAYSGYYPVDVNVNFNLRTRPIDALLQQLRQIFVDTWPRYATEDHPYLSPKVAAPGSPPARWIKVRLVGETDNDVATLAFGDGDIYLLAFANRRGDWFAFSGYESLFPRARRLPADTFGTSYGSLVGTRQDLRFLPLGRSPALSAVRSLARFDGQFRGPDQEQEIKRALATFMVVISEGLRFFTVRDVYTQNWDGLSYLTLKLTDLLVKWGEISNALYHWGGHPESNWDGPVYAGPRKYGIKSAAQALRTVDLLKRPKLISIDKNLN